MTPMPCECSSHLAALRSRIERLHSSVEADRAAWIGHLDYLIETLEAGDREAALEWCRIARKFMQRMDSA